MRPYQGKNSLIFSWSDWIAAAPRRVVRSRYVMAFDPNMRLVAAKFKRVATVRRAGLPVALAISCDLAAFATLRAQPAPPIAIAAQTEILEHEARLSFTLQSCVTADAYVLDNPARAIVDLPEVNFQIDPHEGEATAEKPSHRRRFHRHGAEAPGERGLIASFRFGRLAPGKSRIVIDLSGPAAVISASCAPTPGAAELNVVLAPATETSFKAAARAGAAKQIQSEARDALVVPPAPPSSEKPVIVLDPGHGGVDAGALGRDHVVEKFIALDFAKALGARLRAEDRFRVVFTREDDTFVPLGERVKIARRLNAALFVSIHADALANSGDEVQGATVYTVSDRASDAEAARIADHENKADSNAGEEASENASDVNDILFELTRRETRAYSHVFARSLAEYWKVAARLNKNPRRSAGFVVLKAPDVPSVLLELGYLSNEADVSDLASPAWREKAAQQVAKAIDAFFGQRQQSNGPPSATDAALKATQSTGN
jgi:N-acetylmuramoyl-L-alanine amidase